MAERCPKCRTKVKRLAIVCGACRYAFSDSENERFRRDENIERYTKIALVIAVLLFIGWCSSQPPATPLEKQQVADMLGMPLVAADPANVKLDDSYFNASTRQRCAERYPNDFSMRAACARNASEGRYDFARIWNAHRFDPEFIQALSLCFARYTEAGATDFSMIGACARNQLEGFNSTR